MALCGRIFSSPGSPFPGLGCHQRGRKNATIPSVSTGHQPILSDPLSTCSPTLYDPHSKLSPKLFYDNMDCLHSRHMAKIEEVRCLLRDMMCDPLECMMTIDNLQCLSIDYHFQEEIEEILFREYKKLGCTSNGHANRGLYDAALSFRLLRQQGYYVSPDIFDDFRDYKGSFKLQSSVDIRGMLGLYEASHLGIEGEDMLDEARDFTTQHLKAAMASMEPRIAGLIGHSLENPIRMSLPRFNSKSYLKNQQAVNARAISLHELANLDLNMVQLLHQKELKLVSKWWSDLGLAQELTFARDEPIKWYMWPLAILSNPRFSNYRMELIKPVSLIYIIDDIFDLCGTSDELVLFTEAVRRWDLKDIDRLPRYMQISLAALFNISNEISCLVLKEHGWNPLNSFRKAWTDLCDAFLVEAKWFSSGHEMPKADEYLSNGIISSGLHIVLVHIFCLLGKTITWESTESVDNIPGLISCPATILRLWDDLGSAKDEKQEGKDGSYLKYYMKEQGIQSPNIARQHVMQKISTEWKKLNKECLSSTSLPLSLTEASLNSARMVQIMYDYDQNQRLPVLEELIHSLLEEKNPI